MGVKSKKFWKKVNERENKACQELNPAYQTLFHFKVMFITLKKTICNINTNLFMTMSKRKN